MGSLEAGAMIGHLQIEREVGRGAFATVYLARDVRLDRQVALKVLTAAHQISDAGVGGFLAEARIIARIQSPNVVTLFQLHEVAHGDAETGPSLALEMEFVPGGTLGDVTESGALDHHSVERYLRGILTGLGAAHENGVLHRDVKPANILISSDGHAKLTDFGIARMAGDSIDLDDGAFGTPLYMAPEILSGNAASERSDLWSFGTVAYELLAGRRPFSSGDAQKFFAAVLNEDPDPLPLGVPAHLRAVVASCLEKEPENRVASCRDVMKILDGRSELAPLVSRAPVNAPVLFGRAAELAQLEAAIGSGDATTLLVTGSPGVGKTALCAEAARRARERGVLWIDAELSPAEGPLTTLLDAARKATVGGEEALTRGFGPGGAQLKRLLLGGELPVLESPQQALSTLRHLLTAVTPSRELVLCIDDVQHASEEDVTFLASLARWLSDRPFSLIVSSRPEVAALTELGETHRLELTGLASEPLFALLENHLDAKLPARVAARVFERTEGNPLQALELARHLEETGALARSAGTLQPSVDWDTASLPGRLRDIVHARLESLDDADRTLLEVAAVDGLEFDGGAVAALLGEPMIQILRRLQKLCRGRALIAATSRGYRFAEPPTQEVLYADMGPELRAELHRALAEHLEGRSEHVEPARLARHWEQSGDRDRAAPYLTDVASSAQSRQEIRRFVDLAERAGFLEDPPRVDLAAHLELSLSLAASLQRRGRGEESDALYDRILHVVRDDELLRPGVEVRRALDRLMSGRKPREGIEYWQNSAARLGETVDGARALAVVGRLAKLAGDLDAAQSAFEEADQVFLALDDSWNHSMALSQLGSIAMRGDHLDDARALYAESADVAERNGLSSNAAVSRVNAALAGMLAGQIDGVDKELSREIRMFELAGAFGTAAHTRIHLAEALFAMGQAAAALEVVRTASPVLEQIRHRTALANAWQLRAELEFTTGDIESAAASVVRALADAKLSEDPRLLLGAQSIDALVAVAQGRFEDASRAIATMRAADPDHTQHADGVGLLLCEAVLLGLPAAELSSVQTLVRDEHERLLIEATLLHAAGESCTATLARIAVQDIGLRRASFRLLTGWLAAENARIVGTTAVDAKTKAEAALEAASAIGHTRAETRLRSLVKSRAVDPPR